MIPFFFGDESRRMFGILNPRPPDSVPRLGVVLCNAFGREAIRAHRVYRVLAERLSRAGCDVLRFDYYGSGDSAGDDGEAELAGFSADILTAHSELLKRTGAARVAWLGMRVGAAAVQLALQDSPRELARVVLWDPLADGRDYLDLLRTRHIEWQTGGEDRVREVAPVFHSDPSFYIDEAIGFPLTKNMCDQLRALRFAQLPGGTQVEIAVVSDPGTSEGRAIAERARAHRPAIQLVEIGHGTDWTSERDSTGLVPAPVLNALIERICA